MKNKPTQTLFALWLALALALVPALRAEETTAAPKPEQDKTAGAAAPAAEPAPAEPAVAEAEKKTDAAEKPADESVATPEKADGKLRELGVGVDVDKKPKHRVSHRSSGREVVSFNHNSVLGKDETAEVVVTINGDATVEGTVFDSVVNIVGNSVVTGPVNGEVVAVLGSTKINSHVNGDVVAVLGNVTLGPEAVIEGEVVSVGGTVERDAKSVIRGGINEVSIAQKFPDLGWLKAWFSKCLFWGRPLWVGEDLGWAWLVAVGFLVFYMLLALLFPRGIEKSVEVLEQRPGGTILAALLTMLLTPVLIVLLCFTVVGIALVPFITVGLFFGSIFGKAAVHAWIGRRITNQFGDGPMKHPAIAVMFGGFIIMLLYMVPFLGFLLWKLFAVLGLGMVVYRLVLSMQREKPAKVATAAGSVPPVMPGDAAMGATILPAIISASTLERAGFWRRIGATFLDFILVGMTIGILHSMFSRIDGGGLPLWFAIYNVIMWATKGTTIGGIVCGLKLVRLDDRPVDWGVAIVRGLSAFLSLAVAGLGFIWVAFDDEKQSWHDKIAGTTIVRVPKGTSLL